MPKKQSSIPHVSWRDGRPRFSPGRELRAQGHKGRDLKHQDGRWFSRGEAVDWSDAFREELQAGRQRAAQAATTPAGGRKTAPAAKRAPVRCYTVATLFLEWSAPKLNPKFRAGEPKALAPNTIANYRQMIRVVEDDHPLTWNADVDWLKPSQVIAIFEATWATRGLSTAKAMVLTLSSAISWAIRRDKVRRVDNPCKGLRLETPDPRIRFGTRAEISALVAAADALGAPEVGDMVLLGVWTGQRQDDRLQLVDKGLLNKRRWFRQAKTGAIVAIRQAPELEARLKAAAARRAAARAEALLQARPQEREAVEQRFAHVVLDERVWRPFTDRWAYGKRYAEVRALAAAGSAELGLKACPSVADLWDMDLRDTAVTWMAIAGATIPEIIAVTGHTPESGTRILKHYLARHPEMADSAIGKMMAWYDAGGETEIGL